jgi:UDPglucose--hexose-1-phosphate uridylyltransferase
VPRPRIKKTMFYAQKLNITNIADRVSRSRSAFDWMKKHKKHVMRNKPISELRKDLVSNDWVVIATGRAKRPHEFLKQKRERFNQPKSTCPFERIIPDVISLYALDGRERRSNWWVEAIPNKYPAFGAGICGTMHKIGPFSWKEGVGFHEVIVTRDHNRSIGEMSDNEVELVVRAYQDRYLALKDADCIKYISIFHNHGRRAGATLSHPHSQLIAIPVIPQDFSKSFGGSHAFYRGHKTCVHCRELSYELKIKDRVIYENDSFMVTAPFASKTAFEMRVYPKRHSSHFENLDSSSRLLFANALRVALSKLHRGLRNPDYNFFLHTAPTDDSESVHYYHWHFEILPKTTIWAGFEIGTGIEISTIAPEVAAKFLRKIKV